MLESPIHSSFDLQILWQSEIAKLWFSNQIWMNRIAARCMSVGKAHVQQAAQAANVVK